MNGGRLPHLALVMALAVATPACGSGGGTLTELQRVRSESLDVVLLSPAGALRHGKDRLIVEFRSAADGSLVDVGRVSGSAIMPMTGMPMLGTIDLKPTATAGRYSGDTQLEMAGTWRFGLKWDGPAGAGSVNFSGTVQ